METVVCDICGNEQSDIIWRRGRFGMNVTTVLCKKCGLVYTNPRMAHKQLQHFYKNEYRSIYSQSDVPTERFVAAARRQADDRMRYLSKCINFEEVHRAAEIGCSVGAFLALLKERGISTIGFEPIASHAAFASSVLDLDVKQEFFTQNSHINRESIDLFCMFHVLEHMESPRECLLNIYPVVKPDGLLYIEVPDIEQPYYGNLNFFFSECTFL